MVVNTPRDTRKPDQQVWYTAPTTTVKASEQNQQAWYPTATTAVAPAPVNISYQPHVQAAATVTQLQSVPQIVQTQAAPISTYAPSPRVVNAPQATYTQTVVAAPYQTQAVLTPQQPVYTYLGETYAQPAATVTTYAAPAVAYDYAPTSARGQRPDRKTLWEFLPLIPTLEPGQTVSDFEAAHRHFTRSCQDANARPKPNSEIEAGLSKVLKGKNIFDQPYSHGLFRGQNIFNL
jgi:hypothetical protein